MKLEMMVDAPRAHRLAKDARRVSQGAEPALEDDELQILDEVAEFLEETACVETGERFMESSVTDKVYRVTKWIETDDGQFRALEKEEADPSEVEA